MRVLLAACALLASGGLALSQDAAAELDRQIANCRSLTACLRLLDVNAQIANAHAAEFALRLEQFGDPAKQELLKRALARNYNVTEPVDSADAILRHWQNWSESDIPEVQRVLRANPDSQIGWTFLKIDSAQSIRVLVEDAALYGNSVSAEAVAAASKKALPHIVARLTTEDWQSFGGLLWQISEKISLPNETWSSEAADATKPINERVTALRALSSQRSMAAGVRQALDPLLLDLNREIQFEAVRAVRSTKGEVPAEALARTCPRRDDAFTSRDAPGFRSEWWNCLRDFANFESAARPFGDLIASRFLESPNGADRSDGATVLGYIGYEQAEPKLIELLRDKDWRVVYASMRALGWLGAKDAIPSLEQAGSAHWLPDIKSYAEVVVAALRSSAGELARPAAWAIGTNQSVRRVPDHFPITSTVLIAGVCNSGTWQWQDIRFRAPDTRVRHRDSRLAIRGRNGLQSGALAGRDNGEFGGDLLWRPRRGDAELLYRGNIAAIERSSEGAIVVVHEGGGGWALNSDYDNLDEDVVLISNGPSGFGYALHLGRDSSGRWQMHEVGRLLQGEVMVRSIGRDLYAAWSAGRAIVFDTERLLGLAGCVGN